MGRILLKNKNWSIISHFCSVTQRSWVPGVGMTSKHPQLIPENIGDYVISSWWLHQIKSQVYLVGKISEREDVEMNRKKLRPNVLLSFSFAVSWAQIKVSPYDVSLESSNIIHCIGEKSLSYSGRKNSFRSSSWTTRVYLFSPLAVWRHIWRLDDVCLIRTDI